jgi:predicted amidophosphoribosyltransferase
MAKELIVKRFWDWLGINMGWLCPECKIKLKQTGACWFCPKCKKEFENK